MSCVICLENKEVVNICNSHSMCIDCLNGYVNYESLENKEIRCPIKDCEKISNRVIYNNVRNEVIEIYEKSLKNIIERELLMNNNSFSENEYLGIKNLVDNLINPSCPNCNQAFYEIENTGCKAATCYNCKIKFCGYCCEFMGETSSVHLHVAVCEANSSKSLFGDENFKRDQIRYHLMKIKKILKSVNKNILEKLLNDYPDLRNVHESFQGNVSQGNVPQEINLDNIDIYQLVRLLPRPQFPVIGQNSQTVNIGNNSFTTMGTSTLTTQPSFTTTSTSFPYIFK